MKVNQLVIVSTVFCLIVAVIPSLGFSNSNDTQLLARANSMGTIRVIVGLNMEYQPEGMLSSAQDVQLQHAAISQAQVDLLDRFSGYNISNSKQFATIPYISIETDAAALEAMLNDPDITNIQEDIPVPANLNQSIPFINADDVHIPGHDGSGWAVAILDTGVRKTHEFLDSGKVVSEACYSSNRTGTDLSGNPYVSTTVCPNGLTNSTLSGSGAACNTGTDGAGCFHGTHVAGIAAGIGGTDADTGVAPGADIISIQVFSSFEGAAYCSSYGKTNPCVLTWSTDQILALERVYFLRNSIDIAAVNMSLGGGYEDSHCDASEAARKAAIDNLRTAGIATVISSGNKFYDGAVGTPACISTAITVGATPDNANTVADYSNHADMVDLMAPGSNIMSSASYTDTSYFQTGGTSMAAPHVAGAFAVMKGVHPSWTVSEIETQLENTGVDVTRAGVTKPRIDLWEAIEDAYEENDTRLAAYDLSSDERTWLDTISGLGVKRDVDWYKIEASNFYNRLVIDLRFTNADGNIDLSLYDSDGNELTWSWTSTDNEKIDFVVKSAGTYYLKLDFANTGNTYNLWWDDYRPISSPTPANNTTVEPGELGQLLRVYAPGASGGRIYYDDDDYINNKITATKNGNYLEAIVPYVTGKMNNNGTNYWYVMATDQSGDTLRYPVSGNLTFTVGRFPWPLFLPAIIGDI